MKRDLYAEDPLKLLKSHLLQTKYKQKYYRSLLERKMSDTWEKDAAKAGLKGMTVEEAALRALKDPTFQQLPDPILTVRNRSRN